MYLNSPTPRWCITNCQDSQKLTSRYSNTMALPSEMVGLQNYVSGVSFLWVLLLKRAWKSNFFRSHKENCTKGLILSNAYSYFEKGRRKKCTRQSRIVLWVVLSSLFFKEIWKNGKMGHGYMSAGAEVGSTVAVWGTVYWSYRILPFGIVACTFFRQPCSKYRKIPQQNVT